MQALKTERVLFDFYLPIASHLAKKSRRRIKYSFKHRRRYIGNDDTMLNANQALTDLLRVERARRQMATITGPLQARFTFYFKHETYFTKKGKRSGNLPDLSNLYEFPQDCLQEAEVIDDDWQIESHDGSRRIPWHETALRIELLEYQYP